jgi:gamma-glutamylcyclotransferase (GGCT)/AIG2-like uncharacterized protein YtfP
VSQVRLFVYGSLKRGDRHHDELVGARFLGEVSTAPGYALERVGEYFALIEGPAESSVPGELFELDLERLVALDTFEGDEYERGKIEIVSDNEAIASGPALAYLRRTR